MLWLHQMEECTVAGRMSRMPIDGQRELYEFCEPLPRRFFAHTTTATEASANAPSMASFSGTVVSTATVLRATAGNNAALATGLTEGWSLMKCATAG